MKKVEYFELEGKKYPLVFTYAVSEYVEEKFGSFENFSKVVNKAKTCLDVFTVLNAQGCAYVKYKTKDMPEDPDVCLEPISRDELALLLSPDSNARMIAAITAAFTKAMKNEISAVDKSPNAEGA